MRRCRIRDRRRRGRTSTAARSSPATTGSGKSEIYLILPRYQITASGMYQLPCGINVAGNLVAREGYGMPFFEPVESADPVLPEKRVLLVDPRESRLPGVDVARPARREGVHVRRT